MAIQAIPEISREIMPFITKHIIIIFCIVFAFSASTFAINVACSLSDKDNTATIIELRSRIETLSTEKKELSKKNRILESKLKTAKESADDFQDCSCDAPVEKATTNPALKKPKAPPPLNEDPTDTR